MKKTNPAIERLKEKAMEANRIKYPDNPDYMRVIYKYKDTTANGLTRCIIDWIRFNGGQAERVSVTGRYVDSTKVVTDCLGRKRKIGSAKYIPSSMQRGSADISSTVPVRIFPTGKTFGLSVKWEVKMKDSQSDAQITYQGQIEQAGGYYFIVHSFEEFLDYYNLLMNEKPF